jgi:hypothetical protein
MSCVIHRGFFDYFLMRKAKILGAGSRQTPPPGIPGIVFERQQTFNGRRQKVERRMLKSDGFNGWPLWPLTSDS